MDHEFHHHLSISLWNNEHGGNFTYDGADRVTHISSNGSSILPINVRLGVKPIARPTEPKHENTSIKIYSIPKPAGIVSVSVNMNVTTLIKIILINNSVTDLKTSSSEILRRLKTILSSFSDAFKYKINVATVVTLIPPAVEPGAPPINIKIHVKINYLMIVLRS